MPDFENGRTEYLKFREIDSYLTHSCVVGYQLVGTMRRRCQLDKSWSGSTPVCEGKETSCVALGNTM